MAYTHRFVSAKAEGADGTIVSKNEWNDTHKIDLSGVVAGHRTGVTANRWYTSMQGVKQSLLATAVSAGRLRAFPFVPAKDMTLDQIAFNVTTLLAGFARVGVYNDDGNLYPTTLLADGGSKDTGTVGAKITPISVPLIGGEMYWLVYTSSVAVTIRCLSSTGMPGTLGYLDALAIDSSGNWDVAFTYAALPASYPAGATAQLGSPYPAIFVRGT